MNTFGTIATARGLWNSPLELFERMVAEQGDWAHARIAWQHFFLASHPDLVTELMVARHDSFDKGAPLRRASVLLGRGLLTNEGESHRCQRRRILPAFSSKRVNAHAPVAARYASEVASRWQDGQLIDISAEMMRLSQRVVAKALLDTDIEDARALEVGQALETMVMRFGYLLLPMSGLLWHLPISPMRRLRRARRYLDSVVRDLVAKRRAEGDGGDLISILLHSHDESGEPMTESLIRDEIMTLFLAGHDTTGNALAWTFHLLGAHPEIEAAWHDELDSVLGGQLPDEEDVSRLPYTRRLLTESMRLFPPVPAIGRTAREPVTIGGHLVPRGAIVEISPWVLHRDGRFFPEPEKFDPDRWTESFRRSLPQGAYVPFGLGSRLCIGMPFAWTAGITVLATLGQRWRLRRTTEERTQFLPRSITLRPRAGLPMRLIARRQSS